MSPIDQSIKDSIGDGPFSDHIVPLAYWKLRADNGVSGNLQCTEIGK